MMGRHSNRAKNMMAPASSRFLTGKERRFGMTKCKGLNYGL